MTDYPVDNAESHTTGGHSTPYIATPGKAPSATTDTTISAPGSATTPNPSLVVSAPVRAASSTTMTAGV